MPEIPVTGFVIEALGAAALALMLHLFEREHPRPGVRDWSLGLWALAAGLLSSLAAVHPPRPALHQDLVAMADVPYYWSRSLLLLGTWARWRNRDAGRLRWLLLGASVAVPTVINLIALEPAWRSLFRACAYTLLLSPATLAAAFLLLRVRKDVRRLGAHVLALSFLGEALEDLFLAGVVVANVGRARPALTAASADHLVEVELLLLMFTGIGMAAWLLAEERETAVRLEQTVQRREAMSAMGALVAGVAHEVRNPLFAISSTVDALEARLGIQPAAAPGLATLRGEMQRMSQLMNELLDYGRPVRPGLVTEPLRGVLDEALQSCVPLALDAEVTLEASRDLPALPVPMDRPRLVQVFQNLIQNAIQHTPAGRRVLVGAAPDTRHGQRGLLCAIRDSGPGFDAGDLERVFEPFFTRRRGGTGLGLSIVHRIVQEHAGHVEVANHPEGGGVVSVWLPVVDAAAPAAQGVA
jgi:signal transduction histidine kinase